MDFVRFEKGKRIGLGVRWSADGGTAWRLLAGARVREIPLEEAAKIATRMGMVLPQVVKERLEPPVHKSNGKEKKKKKVMKKVMKKDSNNKNNDKKNKEPGSGETNKATGRQTSRPLGKTWQKPGRERQQGRPSEMSDDDGPPDDRERYRQLEFKSSNSAYATGPLKLTERDQRMIRSRGNTRMRIGQSSSSSSSSRNRLVSMDDIETDNESAMSVDGRKKYRQLRIGSGV